MIKNLFLSYVLASLCITHSYADNRLVGNWEMIFEYGKERPLHEVISFSKKGIVSFSNGICAKYKVDQNQLFFITNKLSQDVSIPLSWKINQDDTLSLGENLAKANIYKKISSIADTCDLFKNWQTIQKDDFEFTIPKDWSYQTSAERNNTHYRLFIANPNANKQVMIMASKLITYDQFQPTFLSYLNTIAKKFPFPIIYHSIKHTQLSDYQLNHDDIFIAESPMITSLAFLEKHNDWTSVIIATQNKDDLKEIPKIVKSIKFQNHTIVSD
ncbi:hypothetical protein [Acinetobacter piscicola]|uniref:hypothetical protein n=1 Tax=Acinetobacter piscicola TaxID=2006115 RepID=UPI000B7DCC6F|nr:hypothetical protein [Acinetobacter piscicola]